MDKSEISTRVGLSLLEDSDTDNIVSRLILSNNLLYNLYSFTQEPVYCYVLRLKVKVKRVNLGLG